MTDRSVLIVGGGIAGVSTAAALRSGGFDGDVTLCDPAEFPYDRPPLSKAYLSGSKNLQQIALQPARWFDDQRIRLLNGTFVSALRSGEGGVELADGTVLSADTVVLATGGKAVVPPIPGVESAHVYVLRTADDADRLRSVLVPGARILVVGAGLIGAEVASTAVSSRCEVTLVDPVETPLAGAVGSEFARWLHAVHATRGITTLFTSVSAMLETAGGVSVEFAAGTEPAEFDVVVLGVGMAPDAALAQRGGLEVDDGVVVDSDRVTSNPAVLAVGDPVRVRSNGVLGARTEHWEAARRDGVRAAATILGIEAEPEAPTWFWTDRHGLHVEVVGRMSDASSTVVRGEIGAPSFSIFGYRDGSVVGAVAVGDSNAVRAATRIISRGIVVDPGRIADTSTDLRKLLR